MQSEESGLVPARSLSTQGRRVARSRRLLEPQDNIEALWTSGIGRAPPYHIDLGVLGVVTLWLPTTNQGNFPSLAKYYLPVVETSLKTSPKKPPVEPS